MREIKFRVWSVPESKFYFFGLLDRDLLDTVIGATSVISYQTTIEEFTGEYDNEGKEIYEGDILELSQKSKKWSLAIVKWERGAWMVDFKDNDKFTFTRLLSSWAKDSIVTGHVHG